MNKNEEFFFCDKHTVNETVFKTDILLLKQWYSIKVA